MSTCVTAGALSSWIALVHLTNLEFQAKVDVEACAVELGQLTTLRRLILHVGEATFAELAPRLEAALDNCVVANRVV